MNLNFPIKAIFSCAAIALTSLASLSAEPLQQIISEDFSNSNCQPPNSSSNCPEITYGPITISDVQLNRQGNYLTVAASEYIEGSLRYKIDSESLQWFHFYHIIIGIKNTDIQDCITHSIGLWDSEGKASFSFNAPEEPGMYQIQIDYHEGHFCSAALEDRPSFSEGIIGMVIVE